MENIEHIMRMAHSPIHNYAIPGLTSWLIGAQDPKRGCVRLFTCSRNHLEHITPHSHRFDFQCLVLRGVVENTVWTPTEDNLADTYRATVLHYGGKPGTYTRGAAKFGRYRPNRKVYGKDAWYGMKAKEIHSIVFGKDSAVLFFEGPKVADSSTILEPYVDGGSVETFEIRPWMFQRG